jgi:hypothetical protein
MVLTIAVGQNAPLLEQDEIATGATWNGNLPRRGRGGGDGPVEGSLVGLALRWSGVALVGGKIRLMDLTPCTGTRLVFHVAASRGRTRRHARNGARHLNRAHLLDQCSEDDGASTSGRATELDRLKIALGHGTGMHQRLAIAARRVGRRPKALFARERDLRRESGQGTET